MNSDDVSGSRNQYLVELKKLMGSPVYDCSGQRLGSLRGLEVNLATGGIHNVILSTRRLLGLGGRVFRLPWTRLAPDLERGRFELRDQPTPEKEGTNARSLRLDPARSG